MVHAERENDMLFTNRITVFFLMCLWFFPTIVYGSTSDQTDLFVVERSNGKWLPNTVLTDGSPVYFYKGHGYSYCKSGLIRFDGITRVISVIPLPEVKSKYPLIAGMAIVNNTLWIPMRRDEGIFLFNLDQQSFMGSLKTAKGTGFGEGANVSIIQDYDNQKIWMSSFKHLDVYDIKTGRWTNLDSIFPELGIGQPSSEHKIMPDGDMIWINAGAHARSRGGLIQIDMKRNRRTVFREELVGTMLIPDRIDRVDLLSSRNYLWAYFTIQNGYNFYIAVYDKKNQTWRSYHQAAIVPAIELLIKELPHVKWLGKNFLLGLSRIISEKFEANHPYRLDNKQLNVLTSAVDRLKAAYKNYNIDPGFENFGLYNHSIHNSNIFEMNKPWGEMKLLQKINLPQIMFQRLVGTTGQNIVLETSEGLATVDIDEKILRYLSPLKKIDADEVDIWWSEDGKKAIIRGFNYGNEGSADYYVFWFLDFEKMAVKEMRNIKNIEEKPFEALPQNILLMDHKKIILQWDGLVVK